MPAYYFQRLEYLDELIRKKATGSPKQLAKKFDVSERTIYDYINILRELGAEIFYCSICESYMYKKHGRFDFKFRSNN
ncbi:HTH domain-containing protein [Belliella kenyensis]|uniref:HTH domain-containing protein n=1 Tax=Belliella kenyensis TaxID=1472724 RepID=A0ABV8ELL0_9BACT|nr:helix-turn-helix domain-containing protein [Belliella kenyensis]MCH7400780.1 helix-turn-helix domain-containing protein [Belliella kenyensis]MDN3601932.1 helix-turn-helix domain-containing protein [Belliella kenyensis]